MIRKPDRRTVAPLALGLAAMLGSCGSSSSPELLSMTLERPSVSLREPIRVGFTARNITNDTIMLDLGVAQVGNFKFDVIPGSGSRVEKLPSPLGPVVFHAGGEVRLAPNEEFERDFLLNEWFTLVSPGDYLLVVEFSGSITSAGRPVAGVKRRFVLPLRVEPRDPEHLAEIGESLAQKVCQNYNPEQAIEAATALKYIADPAVIPALETVLKCGLLAQAAGVEGLERVGTLEAIEALLAAAGSNDAELGELARGALTSYLARQGSRLDSKLKARIETALEKVAEATE